MCMVNGSDHVSAHHVIHITAPGRTTCGECNRTIPVGERHHVGYSLHADGWADPAVDRHVWHRFVVCAQCEAAASWLDKVCGGWLYNGVLIDLEEHRDEHWWPVRTLSLWRLVLGMQQGWRRRDGSCCPATMVKRWAEAGACLAAMELTA